MAHALESVFFGNLDSVHGQLAAHWAAAGHEEAVAHYIQAAANASRLYAHGESVRHLQRALALLPAADAQRAEMHASLGEAFTVLGQHQQAAGEFQQAADGIGDVVAGARLLGRRVIALNGAVQRQVARETYDKAITSLKAMPAASWNIEVWRVWLDLQLSLLDALYFDNKGSVMEDICSEMAAPLESHGTAKQRSEYYTFLARTRYRSLRFRLTVPLTTALETAVAAKSPSAAIAHLQHTVRQARECGYLYAHPSLPTRAVF